MKFTYLIRLLKSSRVIELYGSVGGEKLGKLISGIRPRTPIPAPTKLLKIHKKKLQFNQLGSPGYSIFLKLKDLKMSLTWQKLV